MSERFLHERFNYSTATLETRLATAVKILDSLKGEVRLTVEEHGTRLATMYAVLDDLHREIPEMMAWCVVKHYHGHVPGGLWAPRVWLACTTKKQATLFAPAIEEHYIVKHSHGWTRKETEERADRFKVEYRLTGIDELIDPKLTAKRYIESLL